MTVCTHRRVGAYGCVAHLRMKIRCYVQRDQLKKLNNASGVGGWNKDRMPHCLLPVHLMAAVALQ